MVYVHDHGEDVGRRELDVRSPIWNTERMSSDRPLSEIVKLKAQLADRDAAIADRDAKIDVLARDLNKLKMHMQYLLSGRARTPLISEGQGALFPELESSKPQDVSPSDSDEENPDESSDDEEGEQRCGKSKKGKWSRGQEVDTAMLPHEDRVHELPEEERVCPDTGLPLVPVGEKIFEEIEYQRARLVVIRHRQVIYGLAPEQAEEFQVEPLVAPMPPRPLENCAAGAMLLAWLLVQKYANHLPLYRQEEIFARDGLRLSRSTLCDWVMGAAFALRPIADCLMRKIRAGPIMQLDDTPVKCQAGRGQKHFQGYLWTFVNPEVSGVVYRFTKGRASDLIASELRGFSGFLVGDGYQGNKAAADKVDGEIVMTGCWAHSTRKFRDALCEVPGTARLFQLDIKGLYAVEEEANNAELDPDARLELRHRKSRAILARILARARRLRDEFSDSGKMAEAMKYLLNQRKPLRRFLEDGRVPVDNNRCERSIRPIAIGRRNWLFAGSIRGGEAAAVIYTLIESCRIAKVDCVNYLADVLVRVATHPANRVEDLLPENWTKTVAASQKDSTVRELAMA
jgi:transposase